MKLGPDGEGPAGEGTERKGSPQPRGQDDRSTPARRGYVEIPRVQCPQNGEPLVGYISYDEIKNARCASGFRFQNIKTAVAVLEQPARIFSGVRPEDDDWGGWCYVGCPSTVLCPAGDLRPLGTGYVFSVYLNNRLEVFDWRREPADPADPLSPVDSDDRFKKLAWRRP